MILSVRKCDLIGLRQLPELFVYIDLYIVYTQYTYIACTVLYTPIYGLYAESRVLIFHGAAKIFHSIHRNLVDFRFLNLKRKLIFKKSEK